VENHAVIAMIARAFLGQNPLRFGETARKYGIGRILTTSSRHDSGGRKINDGTAVNLGTMERITVLECAKMVCEFTKHKAEIKSGRTCLPGH